MRYHIPLYYRPKLKVTDVGWPHLRIQQSDFWIYIQEAGFVDDGDTMFSFLQRHHLSHSMNSIRFNPTSWFGKAVLRLPYDTYLLFATSAMYLNLWLRKPYFLHRRIRPHLLTPKIKPQISRHKLIRSRLKPPPSISKPLSPLIHQHKSSFHLLHITPPTPPTIQPPRILHFGLSLPRRHPREGVG